MVCTICWLSRNLHAIILFYLRETPQTDKPTEMTQLMTRFVHVLCIFWHCFRDDGFTLMACVSSQRKHTYVLADTRVITYVIPSVMSSRHSSFAIFCCSCAVRTIARAAGNVFFRCCFRRRSKWRRMWEKSYLFKGKRSDLYN